ncbi:MAG: hypothetical protein ACYDC4_00395 [Candidatus Dormibacteria bacterium]
MSKEIHAYRVWAVRDGERTLEMQLDQPDGRRIATDRVTALREDPEVHEIEMREHLVLYGESDTPTTRRNALRWRRARSGRWYQLPDGNLRSQPSGEPSAPRPRSDTPAASQSRQVHVSEVD